MATTIREAQLRHDDNVQIFEDKEEHEYGEWEDDIEVEELLCKSLVNLSPSSRPVKNYFEKAACLLRGDYLNAPRPLRTSVSGFTAINLARDPNFRLSIDEIALKYALPDLRPAITDYITRSQLSPDNPLLIGGKRVASPQSSLSFDMAEVWCRMKIQSKAYHPPHDPQPSQTINVSPASPEWPFGRYDCVLVNTESGPLYQWPYCSLKGHSVCQIRLVFKPVMPKGVEATPELNNFLVYVQRFDITHNQGCAKTRDSATQMYACKRSLRSNNSLLGDIVPIKQVKAFVHLTPHFGDAADPRLTKENSMNYSTEFWLNHYFNKELFYAFRYE